MALAGLTKEPQLPAQPVEVYANQKKVAQWQVIEKKESIASIPTDVVGGTGALILEFRMPKAASPESIG